MDLDDAITYLESVDGREERWPPGCSHTFAGAAHELARRLRERQIQEDPEERAHYWARQRQQRAAEKRG